MHNFRAQYIIHLFQANWNLKTSFKLVVYSFHTFSSFTCAIHSDTGHVLGVFIGAHHHLQVCAHVLLDCSRLEPVCVSGEDKHIPPRTIPLATVFLLWPQRLSHRHY